MPMSDGPNDRGTSREKIIRSCEASLRRLGTDYVDLYQLHAFDALTPSKRCSTRSTRSRAPARFGISGSRIIRVASHEDAGHRGPARASEAGHASGLLLARRAGVRVGANAARA